jgi:hypothetical protein
MDGIQGLLNAQNGQQLNLSNRLLYSAKSDTFRDRK